jgi:hypothetical protein
MTLSTLQMQTLDLIRKLRFQLQRSPHEIGLNDTEFLEQIVQPLENKIYHDRAVLRMRNPGK